MKYLVAENLKVAYLTYGFGEKASGIGKSSWHLINELRKLGVHIDVFTPRFHFKSFGPPLFYIKNAFLKLKSYDLVHSNEGAALFLHHQNMIETYHHDYKQTYDANSLIFHGLESFQCHKVRRIIVPSSVTRKTLLRYGFTEDKISVIYHGVDHNMFRKNENSRAFLRRKYGISDFFVVINVGQLIKRKSQVDIIKALHGMPNTAFILVGNGEEEKNINKLAQKTGVRLIHFKYVPESFLVDLYNAADVYVHTAIVEGFGLTVLEAMACGLPVVAYKVADFERILKDSGILLEKRDIWDLRQVIEFLKEKPTERERMAQVAWRESKKYTWENSAKEHLEVYREVVRRGGG